MNQRSLSEEAEYRIERSLEREELLGSALELRYGSRLAGLLYLIGEAMRLAGHLGGWHATKPTIGYEGWFDLPFAFDRAARAANQVIEELRPPGEISSSSAPYHKAESVALQFVHEAAVGRSPIPENAARSKEIHRLLGDEITARLAARTSQTDRPDPRDGVRQAITPPGKKRGKTQ